MDVSYYFSKLKSLFIDFSLKSSRLTKSIIEFEISPFLGPFRFRKAGRVWCGGASETH